MGAAGPGAAAESIARRGKTLRLTPPILSFSAAEKNRAAAGKGFDKAAKKMIDNLVY
jgi:hypothetical protein